MGDDAQEWTVSHYVHSFSARRLGISRVQLPYYIKSNNIPLTK